jgi:hypothetical protein
MIALAWAVLLLVEAVVACDPRTKEERERCHAMQGLGPLSKKLRSSEGANPTSRQHLIMNSKAEYSVTKCISYV